MTGVFHSELVLMGKTRRAEKRFFCLFLKDEYNVGFYGVTFGINKLFYSILFFETEKTIWTFFVYSEHFLADFFPIFRHCLARFVEESCKKCLDLQELCKKRLI